MLTNNLENIISHQKTKVLEITDTLREEDKETYFFRKTKLIPNNQLHKKKLFHLSEENVKESNSYATTDKDIGFYMENPTFQEKVNFNSFEILRLVGIGSFGKIFLVKKKNDNKLYAMKVLKKRNLVVKKHLKYALTEMNILKTCNHPFIIKIYYSFQVDNFHDFIINVYFLKTPKNFYFVVDYCHRGDITNQLSKVHKFSIEVAKFYIAELILAIEYLHKKNIIYRDLKPENILVGINHIICYYALFLHIL